MFHGKEPNNQQEFRKIWNGTYKAELVKRKIKKFLKMKTFKEIIKTVP